MLPNNYRTQRKKYSDMAKIVADPHIANRLRRLAYNCLLLIKDPNSERLLALYIGNCRDLDEWVNKTGRYAPNQPPMDLQAKLAEIWAG